MQKRRENGNRNCKRKKRRKRNRKGREKKGKGRKENNEKERGRNEREKNEKEKKGNVGNGKEERRRSWRPRQRSSSGLKTRNSDQKLKHRNLNRRYKGQRAQPMDGEWIRVQSIREELEGSGRPHTLMSPLMRSRLLLRHSRQQTITSWFPHRFMIRDPGADNTRNTRS